MGGAVRGARARRALSRLASASNTTTSSASSRRSGELQAQHSGRLLHRAEGRHELAAVGDWVAVRPSEGEQTGTIEEILPRRSRFSRKVAGELTEEQVVAANIDTVFLVMGLDRDYNPRRLERYLLMAYESGASPVVLLSKADLSTDLPARVAEITALAPGTPVHAISSVARTAEDGTVEPPDMSAVVQHLGVGRTGALLGSSGVGKSTLINAIAGTDRLKTAAVRASDSRGRHTTRHRQLIVLPGQGLLIDTPGMRELQLWDVDGGARETRSTTSRRWRPIVTSPIAGIATSRAALSRRRSPRGGSTPIVSRAT